VPVVGLEVSPVGSLDGGGLLDSLLLGAGEGSEESELEQPATVSASASDVATAAQVCRRGHMRST
jgi:hypothetical protein